MRVLEPQYFKKNRPKRSKAPLKKRLAVTIVFLAVLTSVGYFVFGQQIQGNTNPNSPANVTEQLQAEEIPKVLKQFTAEEFKQAYSSYVYPNTQPITSAPEITGNEEADARIRKVAEERGYKLTALPVSSIVKTGEPGLEGDDLMQPNALVAWTGLKVASQEAGLTLKMTSAYRSIDYQRTLFLRRLQNAGVDVGRVLDGNADDEIDAVLSRAALPGYSRHHTGFTMDLSCNGVGLEAFSSTACYKWLATNNFENVKKFGWIPSYPEGVGSLGPEPEPWEFIWIGTSRTYE